MDILFLTFNELSASNGISKKILYQKKALEINGFTVHLVYVVLKDFKYELYINDRKIASYHRNIFWTLKLVSLKLKFLSYVKENCIKNVYVRYTQYASPTIVALFKAFKCEGMKVVLEIPSYPYDDEFKTVKLKMFLIWERFWRERMAKYIDYIVTFSNFEKIWLRPTLKINNGIDFSSIAVKSVNRQITNRLEIIAVAGVSFWHGFDRVIEGLKLYYESQPQNVQVYFNIVGKGNITTYNSLVDLVSKYNLNKYVIFHGAQFGTALDALFESADVAIASLGCHRKNIEEIKALKNVEYAARGIPFIYSEINQDFDEMPYVKKEMPDDSPINICNLIEWRKNVSLQPIEIRNTIVNSLSWTSQMKRVTEYIVNVQN